MRTAVALSLMAALGACERPDAPGGGRAAPAPAPARAGRTGIPLPGDCRGAWWDPASESLYVTDVTHDALIRWREGAGFDTVARLPPASSLGGVIRLADGRFVITSFGFGEGVVYVVDRGEVRAVGLDPSRRRTGLALAPDGAVYVAYFEIAPGDVPRGGVSRISLERDGSGGGGSEVDVGAADLRKPLGLAATGSSLYVTDPHRAAVYAIPREGGGGSAIARDLPDPELVAALPGGELAVVSRAGEVFRVPPGGAAIRIAHGFGEVRGIAYDAARSRLFLVEQRAAAPRHQLHILPVAR